MASTTSTLLRGPFVESRLIPGHSGAVGSGFIDFVHPGYSDAGTESNDILVSLPTFDNGGVYYDIAHTACAILAANRWDGYFSLDKDGSDVVEVPRDGILRKKRYYFHVPDASSPYPVVVRFRDWRFPHDHLPPSWAQFRDQLEGEERQGSSGECALSGYADAVESPHLVPVAQATWWTKNRMNR